MLASWLCVVIAMNSSLGYTFALILQAGSIHDVILCKCFHILLHATNNPICNGAFKNAQRNMQALRLGWASNPYAIACHGNCPLLQATRPKRKTVLAHRGQLALHLCGQTCGAARNHHHGLGDCTTPSAYGTTSAGPRLHVTRTWTTRLPR